MKTDYSLKSRLLSLLLTLVMIIGIVPGTAFVAMADEPGNAGEDIPGSVILSKTATAIQEDEYAFNINLTIKGIDTISAEPTHVVLVIDRSGSMGENNSKRLKSAQTAAKELVQTLLPVSNVQTKISLVTFSDDVKSSRFYGASQSDKDELLTAIDKISADGGTNIQAGLREARLMLANVDGPKYIVLLSDGAPTYSYRGTSTIDYNGITSVAGVRNYSFLIDDFEYDDLVSYGRAYNIQRRYWLIGWNYTDTNYKIENRNDRIVYDNGLPTISEAALAKEDSVIYCINLDGGTTGSQYYTLLNCATSDEHLFSVDSEGLKDAFREISTGITYAVENGVVTDPMGKYFELDEDSLVVSPETLTPPSYNKDTKTITWAVGTVQQDTPITLSYKVYVPEKYHEETKTLSATKGMLFETNLPTYLTYDSVNTKDDRANFVVPKVALPNDRGTIKRVAILVDEEGKYLDKDGSVLPEQYQDDPMRWHRIHEEDVLNIFDDVTSEYYDTYIFQMGKPYEIPEEFDNKENLVGYAPHNKDGLGIRTVTHGKEVEYVLYVLFEKAKAVDVTVNYYLNEISDKPYDTIKVENVPVGTPRDNIDFATTVEEAGFTDFPAGYKTEGVVSGITEVVPDLVNIISVVFPIDETDVWKYTIEYYQEQANGDYEKLEETDADSGTVFVATPTFEDSVIRSAPEGYKYNETAPNIYPGMNENKLITVEKDNDIFKVYFDLDKEDIREITIYHESEDGRKFTTVENVEIPYGLMNPLTQEYIQANLLSSEALSLGYKFSKTDPAEVTRQHLLDEKSFTIIYVADKTDANKKDLIVEHWKDGSDKAFFVADPIEVYRGVEIVEADIDLAQEKVPGYIFDRFDPVLPKYYDDIPNGTVKAIYVLDEKDTIEFVVNYHEDGEIKKTVNGDIPVGSPEVSEDAAEYIDVLADMTSRGYILDPDKHPTAPDFPFVISAANNEIDIYFVSAKLTYYVDYQTVEGEKIKDSEAFTVNYGDEVTDSIIANIPGYKFVSASETLPIQIKSKDMRIVLIYKLDDDVNTGFIKYDIVHISEDGSIVFDTVKDATLHRSKAELVIDDIELSLKALDSGYVYLRMEPSDKVSADDLEKAGKVTIVYEKDESNTVDFTVQHIVEETGQVLATEPRKAHAGDQFAQSDFPAAPETLGYKIVRYEPETWPKLAYELKADGVKIYYAVDDDEGTRVNYRVDHIKDTDTVFDSVEYLQVPISEARITEIPVSANVPVGYAVVGVEPSIPTQMTNGGVLKVYYAEVDGVMYHEYNVDGTLEGIDIDVIEAEDLFGETVRTHVKATRGSYNYNIESLTIKKYERVDLMKEREAQLEAARKELEELQPASGASGTLNDPKELEIKDPGEVEVVPGDNEDPENNENPDETEIPDETPDGEGNGEAQPFEPEEEPASTPETEEPDNQDSGNPEDSVMIPSALLGGLFSAIDSDLEETPVEKFSDATFFIQEDPNAERIAALEKLIEELEEQIKELKESGKDTVYEKVEEIKGLTNLDYVFEKGFRYEVTITYNRTTGGGNEGGTPGGSGGGDPWDGGGSDGSGSGNTVDIGDGEVPLTEAPIDIVDEEVPLGDLPTTGRQYAVATGTAGFMTVFAGATSLILRKGKRKFKK